MDIHNTPTLGLGLHSPDITSQDNVKETINCYNLRPRVQSISQSVIEPHPMPSLKLNTPNNKLNHVYASAAQALQIKEILSKIQANLEAWLANSVLMFPLLLSNLIPVYSLIVASSIYVDKLAPMYQSSMFKHQTLLALK